MTGLVCIGTDPESSRQAVDLVAISSGVSERFRLLGDCRDFIRTRRLAGQKRSRAATS